MSHTVRRAKASDIIAVSRLAQQSVEATYGFYSPAIKQALRRRNSKRALAATVILKRRLVLVAEHQGKLVGYLIGNPNTDGVALVYSLYVSLDRRAKGAGRDLLAAFEIELSQNVQRIMVWTEVAADYYRQLGWNEQATLAGHWWGQDWVIFTKDLKSLASSS